MNEFRVVADQTPIGPPHPNGTPTKTMVVGAQLGAFNRENCLLTKGLIHYQLNGGTGPEALYVGMAEAWPEGPVKVTASQLSGIGGRVDILTTRDQEAFAFGLASGNVPSGVPADVTSHDFSATGEVYTHTFDVPTPYFAVFGNGGTGTLEVVVESLGTVSGPGPSTLEADIHDQGNVPVGGA